VIVQYLRLAVWPHPLVVDYSDWPIANTLAEAMPGAIVIAALGLATLWALRHRPAVGFLGAWCFLVLAPSSSLLPIITEVAAERRMYLPLAALVGLIVVAGWSLLRRAVAGARLRRGLAAGLVTVLAGTLGAATVRRNEVYRSEVAILCDVIAKRPTNARAHYNLGIALAEQGRREEAVRHFVEALRLKPDYAEAHGNLGVVLAEQGKRKEAIAHYVQALRLNPGLAEAHNNLGLELADEGRLEEAIVHYTEALRLQPNFPQASENLSVAFARNTHGDRHPK